MKTRNMLPILTFWIVVSIFALGAAISRGATTQLNVLSFGARGDGTTDDSAAFQKAFTAAGSLGAQLLIPQGTFRIAQAVTATNAISILNGGTVSISGQFIYLNGVTWQGGTMIGTPGTNERKNFVRAGNVSVRGGTWIGPCHMWTVYPTAPISSFEYTGNTSISNNFTVLREDDAYPGGHSISNVIISGNTILKAQIDGIQWNNISGRDKNGLIIGNTVNTVTYNGTGFGGMGICVAGWHTIPSDTNLCTSGWVVSDNQVFHAAHGLHFEYVSRCVMDNNYAEDISLSYTPNKTGQANGIEWFGVVYSDSRNNSVFNAPDDGTGFTWAYVDLGGYTGAGFQQSPRGNRHANNYARNGNMYWEIYSKSVGADADELTNPPNVEIVNCTINNGYGNIKGWGHFLIQGNNWISSPGQPSAIMDFKSFKSVDFDARYQGSVVMLNNQFMDKLNYPSVTLTNLQDPSFVNNNLFINAKGNNFGVESTNYVIGWGPGSMWTTNLSFPAGLEFEAGDVIQAYNTSATNGWVVTSKGSASLPDDYYDVFNAAQGIILRATNNNNGWLSPNMHYVGQRITLSNGGTPVSGVVRRAYYDSTALYGAGNVIQLSDTSGAVLDLTGVVSGTVSATTEVVYKPLGKTQIIASERPGLQIFSGANDKYTQFQWGGASAAGELGYVGVAGQFLSGSTPGDAVVKSLSGNLLLGAGNELSLTLFGGGNAVFSQSLGVNSNLVVSGSISAALLQLATLNTADLTTTNGITWGTTNAVPANTNAVLWVPVTHGGNNYAMPLMALP